MKVELSKREIEVILGLMGSGITFETTHFYNMVNDGKKRINLDDLMERLKKNIVINPLKS